MSTTRSIIQRLNPGNVFGTVQCLHRVTALFAEDEWLWKEERAGAWVFDSYDEAFTQAATMPYTLAEEPKTMLWPFAAVLGNPQLDDERSVRHRNRAARLDAIEAGELRMPSLPASEVFDREERRHLA